MPAETTPHHYFKQEARRLCGRHCATVGLTQVSLIELVGNAKKSDGFAMTDLQSDDHHGPLACTILGAPSEIVCLLAKTTASNVEGCAWLRRLPVPQVRI